jgi:hypothetical protein
MESYHWRSSSHCHTRCRILGGTDPQLRRVGVHILQVAPKLLYVMGTCMPALSWKESMRTHVTCRLGHFASGNWEAGGNPISPPFRSCLGTGVGRWSSSNVVDWRNPKIDRLSGLHASWGSPSALFRHWPIWTRNFSDLSNHVHELRRDRAWKHWQ